MQKKISVILGLIVLTIVFCWAKYMFGYKDGNFYIINEQGEFVNNNGYKRISDSYDDNGLATVVVENRWKPGTFFYREYLLVIDTKGNVKYKIATDKAYDITHNMVLGKDEKGIFVSEFIDDNGKSIYKVPKEKRIEESCDASLGVVPFFVYDANGNELYGYVNMNDNVLVEPIYGGAGNFNEDGLASVCSVEGKYGLVNINGEVVCEPIYSRIGEFSENLAVVETSEGKCGFIDTDGKFVINPVYNSAGSFSEGMAAVETDDGKWGYIDVNGNYVINPAYDSAEGFSEGLAFVKCGDKYYYIDHAGSMLIECSDSQSWRSFHEGYKLVEGENGRFAYMDKNGKLITDYEYLQSSGDFCNGFAMVSSDGRKGFINTEGEIVIDLQFSDASNFTADGHALVRTINKQYGYINSDGTWLFEPQFDYATEFSCGVAFVKMTSK